MADSLLWIPATLAATLAQTARNAMQRRLTETIGTVGATQVRFLYGLPFAILLLGLMALATGESLPGPTLGALGYTLMGATTQIVATGLMLAAMRERSFAVVITLTKIEPVEAALFGLVILGDRLTPLGVAGIVVATAGVVIATKRSGPRPGTLRDALRPVVYGILSGGFFALASIGFRGAILALPEGSFLIRATTILALGLTMQTAILLAWMGAFDRAALMGSLRAWRQSLAAGAIGAGASQLWFIGFALTAAANVRTLALVEILLAQAVSAKFMGQRPTGRELLGAGLVIVGVTALMIASR